MKKILIVNDDYEIRLSYQGELMREGYEVITADNCVGILETIALHKPDLIILGIRMGEVNELNALEEVRNANHDMPVILSTDYLPLDMVQNLLKLIEKSHDVGLEI